jgi:hypothetical protein
VQCWLNHGIPFLEIMENNYKNSVGAMLAKPWNYVFRNNGKQI